MCQISSKKRLLDSKETLTLHRVSMGQFWLNPGLELFSPEHGVFTADKCSVWALFWRALVSSISARILLTHGGSTHYWQHKKLRGRSRVFLSKCIPLFSQLCTKEIDPLLWANNPRIINKWIPSPHSHSGGFVLFCSAKVVQFDVISATFLFIGGSCVLPAASFTWADATCTPCLLISLLSFSLICVCSLIPQSLKGNKLILFRLYRLTKGRERGLICTDVQV